MDGRFGLVQKPLFRVVFPILLGVLSTCGGDSGQGGTGGTVPVPVDPNRPNFLLLMAEDMSLRVAAFGDPVAVTPNLDALAAEGVRYPNTFTSAGVCAPSRAAHILGMHQIATGTQHMRTGSYPGGGYAAVPPAQVKAYPELLRAAGYYTYTDGKQDYQLSNSVLSGGPFSIWDSVGEWSPNWWGRAAGQPFFGLRNFGVTHESGIFPPLGNRPHSISHFVMQVIRWWKLDGGPPTAVQPGTVTVPSYYPDTPAVREDLARHYNNISGMDKEVGDILQQLEDAGLAESTIVIWTSDHGDGLPRAKRELYDSGIKVPMIIRWPQRFRPEGVVPGTVETRLVSLLDFAPTILQLAGVAVPANMHGRSFVAGEPRRYIYASRDRIDEVPDRQRAIRDDQYKYIRSWNPELAMGHPLKYRENINMVREMRALHVTGQLNAAQAKWFEPMGAEQFYDLARDPWELNNLADDPVYRSHRHRLSAALDKHLEAIGDWSEQSEADMLARFQPRGEQELTPEPSARISAGKISLKGIPGASLSYRLDAGPWLIYVDPVSVPEGARVEAKAVRYGWRESPLITVPGVSGRQCFL